MKDFEAENLSAAEARLEIQYKENVYAFRGMMVPRHEHVPHKSSHLLVNARTREMS